MGSAEGSCADGVVGASLAGRSALSHILNMLGSKKVALTVSLNWLLLIFVVAVTLIALYIFGPSPWKPALVFSAAVLAAASTLANAANGLDSRGSAAAQARVVAAMSYIDRWNSPQFFHCKKNGRAVIDYFKEHPHVGDQIAYLDQNPDAKGNLIDVLNQFEALEIGIRRKVVDEETAKEFFRSVVIQYWNTTEAYTKYRRAERNNARLQKEFEALYERWKG
jgi:hypothetical protein